MDNNQNKIFDSKFEMPNNFLEKLYEFTGDNKGNSGFVLSYVDDSGRAMVISKYSSQIVEMGLRKSLEKYLIQMEEGEASIDISENL
jgi:hypothetical protein